jgi:hypothetical protein
VKALDAADAAPDAGYAPVLDDGADAELALTPWTIRNRYYAADVHFAARARGWRVRDAFGVPALVVVWAHGAVRPAPPRSAHANGCAIADPRAARADPRGSRGLAPRSGGVPRRAAPRGRRGRRGARTGLG